MKRLILLTVVLCLLAAFAAVFLSSHIWAAGQFISKDVMELDLRSNRVSIEDVRKLSEALPGCEILWDVPFQNQFYAPDTQELTVTSLTQADVQVLGFLPGLRVLNAQDCRDYASLLAFRNSHPNCKIQFTASISGQDFPGDAEFITVQDAEISELETMLPLMHNLKQVSFSGNLPAVLELNALANQYPFVRFDWPVEIGGETHRSTETALNLSGLALTRREAEGILDNFPYLNSADMHGCGIDRQNMIALAEEFPNCAIGWDIQIGNLFFSTDVEEMDISYQPVAVAELEALLPCFPNVKKIIMTGCGLDDAAMDALDRRHADVRFVWTVKLGNDSLRTDAAYFYPYRFSPSRVYNDEQLKALQYCRDMEAIDLSRMTNVKDCSWLVNMPKLKYLVIAESGITDISPLSSLKNLVYLEMYHTGVTDYSPLLECTALEDLNLGETYGDPAPIAMMTWLKNVWWSGVHGTYGKPCSNAKAVLEAALPNTELHFNLDSPVVNNGWRKLPNYMAMRDLMGASYLN